MFFGQNREQLRQFFIDTWHKYQAQLPLESLEQIVAGVIAQHPEYHVFLEKTGTALGRDYLPELDETNPFLHMGMHIALSEQLASNRPAGITELYQRLVAKHHDSHEVEHRMAECLGEALWRAQRDGKEPDEQAYLECLQRL